LEFYTRRARRQESHTSTRTKPIGTSKTTTRAKSTLVSKLFVEFVALIYLSYIKKKMQDTGLFENWTLQGLLDELDTIERFESPEHGRLIGEVTKKQKDIYTKLGMKSPSL